ncbi:hypothetical protein MBAV_001536 [Candidatus Magnetobacterium bavaricum]|uniref:Uncharacterized protein n=1 Tax=Candidatus Magnetobacterium bavaricum TaxID=29290 RepID=A0A0F3GWJ9_9BACT|nr:hypothetical protein MBAV_001536 [Candidatus Magnetobacterium bavaricum]
MLPIMRTFILANTVIPGIHLMVKLMRFVSITELFQTMKLDNFMKQAQVAITLQ